MHGNVMLVGSCYGELERLEIENSQGAKTLAFNGTRTIK